MRTINCQVVAAWGGCGLALLFHSHTDFKHMEGPPSSMLLEAQERFWQIASGLGQVKVGLAALVVCDLEFVVGRSKLANKQRTPGGASSR